MNDNVIWKPQPKQFAFMQRPEFECLYGGAAGGGKSDALVAEALRQVHIPHYKGIIFRRTFPQLRELIDKTMRIYPRSHPGAKYNSTAHIWTFPSGAQIWFGSMQHEQSKYNYHGQAFDFVGFDELTTFTATQYKYMYSRCRPNGPGTRCYVRATTNPGNIGHGWVKDRFITAATPMTTITEDVEIESPSGEVITVSRDRIFIPATVFDNKELLKNDPGYIASLGMLPEAEKAAQLYGDWNSFSGQVFTEWRNDPKHYGDRKWTHVVTPFPIPETWPIMRGLDWGYARPFSVQWFAVAPGGKLYLFKELYGCTGEPNVGVKWTAEKLADEIYKIEHEDPNIKDRDVYGVADPAIFAKDGGPSIAESMEQCQVYFDRGKNDRLQGKMQMHYYLAFDEEGDPMLQVFDTCKHFIRCLPTLVYSEVHVEDVETSQEDHNYDSCRYIVMSRPIEARVNVQPDGEWTPPPDDPLNLNTDDYEYDTFTLLMNS